MKWNKCEKKMLQTEKIFELRVKMMRKALVATHDI